MTMPTWQDILLPFLQTIQEGTKTQLRSVTEVMIAHFDLTEDEREVREKNGQRKFITTFPGHPLILRKQT